MFPNFTLACWEVQSSWEMGYGVESLGLLLWVQLRESRVCCARDDKMKRRRGSLGSGSAMSSDGEVDLLWEIRRRGRKTEKDKKRVRVGARENESEVRWTSWHWTTSFTLSENCTHGIQIRHVRLTLPENIREVKIAKNIKIVLVIARFWILCENCKMGETLIYTKDNKSYS